MSNKIYEEPLLYIEVEKSEIPWLKIFPNATVKEWSDCDTSTRERLFEVMLIVEKQMRAYYQPEKINIASFGNYVPQLHIHVMARFQEDSYYPESMWGVKQRDAKLTLPSFEGFLSALHKALS
ncbi:HIT family protein [Sulfurospirillum sp. 1612]|uniref:HIT family protein n=1 Tax=Sulfurospirillum sp. 1612 TaxID=3094835 RepID=UPI002F92E349